MTCPRCKEEKDMRFPALSRADNKTLICSPCGTEEALEQYTNNGKLNTDWLNRSKHTISTNKAG